MRDKRRSRTWMGWLTVVVLGVALVSGFVLVGGLGTGQGGVALARTSGAGATSSTSTAATSTTSGSMTTTGSSSVSDTVSGINTDACAGPRLAGSVIPNGAPTGQVTLGLFGLVQHQLPLARRFVDTGQRVTVSFGGASSVPFLFQSVPGGSVDYFVAVIPSSGPITNGSQLVESAVIPVCGTRKATETTTVTATVTSTSTSTTTINLTQTVTVSADVEAVTGTTSTSTETSFTTSTSTATETTVPPCANVAQNALASAKTAGELCCKCCAQARHPLTSGANAKARASGANSQGKNLRCE